MEPTKIHLSLGESLITVRIELYSGVMTEKTLTGKNCYLELLEFLKQVDSTGRLHAEINLE